MLAEVERKHDERCDDVFDPERDTTHKQPIPLRIFDDDWIVMVVQM